MLIHTSCSFHAVIVKIEYDFKKHNRVVGSLMLNDTSLKEVLCKDNRHVNNTKESAAAGSF